MVGAFVPGQVSVVRVVVSVSPQASSSDISDGSSARVVPSGSLEGLASEVSDSGGIAVVSPVGSGLLDGDGVVSVGNRSNGSGSPVEDPPLLVVVWVVVLDSKSEVSVTNVLVPDDGSVSAHSGFDLESNSAFEWISWEVNSSSVEREGLSHIVEASVPMDISVLSVGSLNLQTLTTWVSDVVGSSWEVGGSLV